MRTEKKSGLAGILRDLEGERRKKIAAKLPDWAGVEGLQYPSSLSLEQCSSSATARYKAALTSGTLADLTGGLGVDSAAFARSCKQVYYIEQDAALAEAARNNFARLGLSHIDVRCARTSPEVIRSLPPCDWMYLDPARRSAGGRKVFLLEQCSPDVTALLPALRERAGKVLLKLSPMADLTMLARRLGAALCRMHVVESEGECKEVLCELDWTCQSEEYEVLATDMQASFRFRPQEEKSTPIPYARYDEAAEAPYLYEPGPALMKAGAWGLLCERFKLRQLDPATHLYLSDGPLPLGRSRRIEAVLPFKPFAEIARRYPRAELSVRGLPLSTDALRAALGLQPGGNVHLYGCLLDGSKCVIATR